jgi:type II secretory pathway component GspD/PulD (secretin)
VGGSGFADLLDNQLEANIARAKAVELADGRIVSFLTVEDLPQVRIDTKLYEINRTDLLAWDSSLNNAKVADFDTNGIDPNQNQPPNGGLNADGEVILGHHNTDISNVLSFLAGGFNNRLQIGGGRYAIDAAFNLLETQGIARSISSPSLTVLSGELASFGDGGSITVQNTLTTGVGVGSTVSFPDQLAFGIHLAIRPLIDEDGFITLDVVPSVSNPDFELTQLVRETTGTPQESVSFAEKSMRTSARLRDGEVLLIGGLTDSSSQDKKSDTPGLAQIPLIGWLFHDKSFEDKNRELVIMVNPTIVRDTPVGARMWAYPKSSELMPRRKEPAPPPSDQHSTQPTAKPNTEGKK